MESHIVKIKNIHKVTHDVLGIRVEKPAGYTFVPGQATEVAINRENWIKERRPFTFTCLPTEDYLEFTIKTYPSRQGVTNELLKLKPDDELIIHDVWGAIHYKGPGLFIAGGAGVTPFIAIFRHLASGNNVNGNRLLFANKTKDDIILRDELAGMLGENMINVLSDEDVSGYRHGFITQDVLKETLPGFDKNVYICGPPPMMDAMMKSLGNLGVSEKLVTVEI
jgi:ferredoxin-NADP reductase